MSKKYRELIIQKARLKRLSKTKVCFAIFPMDKNIEQRIYLKFCIANEKKYYLSVMKRLREQIRRKRADLWKENSWILHHDNAQSRKAIIVNEFLAKNSTNIIEQPPYSPDMAPADFFLFPKFKLTLRGTRFQSIECI